MGELASARLKAVSAPLKLARDVRSYQVEAAFLGSRACAAVRDGAGVHVPRVFATELRPCAAAPIESRFATLAEAFEASRGWEQTGALDETQATASLRTLARFHAFFWAGSRFWTEGGEAAAELEAAVWPMGCYWQPSMQPPSQFENLSEVCAGHLARFGEGFRSACAEAGVDSDALSSLGGRLQAVAKATAAASHPFDGTSGGDAEAVSQIRTLLHGDPKAANLFFRACAENGAQIEVALIDFQWCGFGLAATEVAHHLAASLSSSVFAEDGVAAEARLLDAYHAALLEGLADFGVAPSVEAAAREVFSRAMLQAQYETALLDMGRLVFGYQWCRADFETPSFNRNSYNKDLGSAVWLLARCHTLLEALA